MSTMLSGRELYLRSVVEKGQASDQKMERLLNLVLALLSSKRYLTKTEITSAVPGYEGTAEARDRMFERDKDELRRIGIEIEVGKIDPLFEDEMGYRIRRDNYQIQLKSLSPDEGLIASAALSLVADMFNGRDARSLRLRVAALSEDQESVLTRLLSQAELVDLLARKNFRIALEAIRTKHVLRFAYVRDSDGERQERQVEPLQLLKRGEEWLLRAWDRERAAVRIFLLENISGEATMTDQEFEGRTDTSPIGDLAPQKVVCSTTTEASRLLLLEGGHIEEISDGSVMLSFQTYNFDRLLRMLVSIDPQIEIIQPIETKALLLEIKERLINAIR